jgi:hypothetical protein
MAGIGEKEDFISEAAAHRKAAADRLGRKSASKIPALSDEQSATKRAEITELFTEYDAADLEVENRKNALEAAISTRSDVVRKIGNVIAPLKRVSRNGKQLTVVQRGDHFFIRGQKDESETTFKV